METLFNALIILISLAFLGIVAMIVSGAIPGMFFAAAAPWLDWLLPIKKKR